MNLKSLAIATALTLTAILPVSAFAETCKVADPSGTPLKYRSAPYGKIIGSLKNGTSVYINGEKYDDNGKLWVRAFSSKTNKFLGWVYYDYLSCNQ